MIMTDIARVSGKLSKKDLKRLTGSTRTGTVGPTTVYYAGVTAPIISAGVAVFSRNLMHNAGYITPYWMLFISTLIAAFAGICWYLIFMRWSYRNTYGRSGETTSESLVEMTENALTLKRGNVTTDIAWPAVVEVQKRAKFLTLIIENGQTILIPDHWFGGDKAAKQTFHDYLSARTSN